MLRRVQYTGLYTLYWNEGALFFKRMHVLNKRASYCHQNNCFGTCGVFPGSALNPLAGQQTRPSKPWEDG